MVFLFTCPQFILNEFDYSLQHMEISLQKSDPLHAVMTIKVGKSDYEGKLEAAYKKVQRTASMPGFRPGKVPQGMIKKMYGKGILVEEMNTLLNDSLYAYIEEHKIAYLGNPMPKDTGKEAGDWNNPDTFEFSYELGLAPEFEYSVSPKETFTFHEVIVSEKMIDDYINDIRRRHGKFMNPETAAEGDILYGSFTELNENGEAKEGGIQTTTTLALDFIKNEKEKFIGAKNDDSIVFNPAKAIDNATEMAAMFNISKEQAESLKSDFRFEVKSVNRIEKAEVNPELYTKIFGENQIQNEEEFRNKVKEQIASTFVPDSDRLLRHDIMDAVLDDLKLPLPDEFLKRWMQAANEKPVSTEDVEKEYPVHSRMIRWQLVIGKILKQHPDIVVNREELESYARAMVRNQFTRYGMYNIEEDKLASYANELLKKESEVRRYTTDLLDHKVFQLMKNTYTLNKKQVPYEEFIKLHEHQHEHAH